MRKKIVMLLFIVLFSCTLVGCDTKKETIKPSSLTEILEKNNYMIVDVRTPEEYDEEHIKGAINIPYDKIDEKVELDKDKQILVYCRSGQRSRIAYNTLKRLGYDVYDLGAYKSIRLEKE